MHAERFNRLAISATAANTQYKVELFQILKYLTISNQYFSLFASISRYSQHIRSIIWLMSVILRETILVNRPVDWMEGLLCVSILSSTRAMFTLFILFSIQQLHFLYLIICLSCNHQFRLVLENSIEKRLELLWNHILWEHNRYNGIIFEIEGGCSNSMCFQIEKYGH